MSPRKLSDSDKHDILKLYREPEETTSTLATRYSVSSSTISRLLKSRLAEQEYEALIQQKRTSRTPSNSMDVEELESETPEETPTETLEQQQEAQEQDLAIAQREMPDPEASTPSGDRRIRKRPSVALTPIVETQVAETQLSLLDVPTEVSSAALSIEPPLLEENSYGAEASSSYSSVETSVLEEILGEELTDLDDEDDDEDDDLEDSDQDDWEDDAIPAGDRTVVKAFTSESRINVQVLPLSEASLPKICYLVVDRAAELIARPLKEFGDLGRIPVEEIQQKTLPVFDNHRVARRYSNRAQRVIKIPDGRMLQKVCAHLKAKGITRLLIDGQIYSIGDT